MSLGEAFPILWLNLYAAGGDAIPVELFHRLVREAVNERFGCVVDDLAGDVEHENIVRLAGRDDPDQTLIPLTPIGLSAWPWPGAMAWPRHSTRLGCLVGRSIGWQVIGSMRQRAYSLTLRASSA